LKKQKKILLSFVGTKDAGKLIGNNDGAILTALKQQKFDEVILLWNAAIVEEVVYEKNRAIVVEVVYEKVVKYLKREIIKRKYASKVSDQEIKLSDVTDHNQIYLQLKEFTDTLPKNKSYSYTAAISSGTPAMQVCWILLAESGDFSETNPLLLIKIKDPKFGQSENIPVKIDTSLPRIVRLKNEVESLKKDLIPIARVTISKPLLRIGDSDIILAPMELTYYKYFAERVIGGKGDEKFTGFSTTNAFLDRVIEIHEELFPDLDTNRMDLINIRKKDIGLSIYTFRGNISKLNKKIKGALQNKSIAKTFEISSEGGRGAKFYGIKAPRDKIKIVK